jgi:hypothetical protein
MASPTLSKLVKVALLKYGFDLLPIGCVAAWPVDRPIPLGWKRQGKHTFLNGKVKSIAIQKGPLPG